VRAGKDEFESSLGPWSVLGGDSLVVKEGSYIPDYTAFIESESIRLVRIIPNGSPPVKYFRQPPPNPFANKVEIGNSSVLSNLVVKQSGSIQV
jgi:hypothetical protein